MTPVLITEIVSALVACVAAVVLFVQFITSQLRKQNKRRPKGHTALSLTLVIAAIIHGIAAMIYGSGAPATAYVLGWIGLVCFAISGLIMLMPMRQKLQNARAWHVVIFLLGIIFIVAHAIAGRM